MRRETSVSLAVLALFCSITPSHALDNGTYSAPYGDGMLSLTVKGANVSIEVGTPGCQGDLQGRVKKAGKTKWSLRAAGCIIEFRQKGKRITIEEVEYCPMHGAACSFSGVVTRK